MRNTRWRDGWLLQKSLNNWTNVVKNICQHPQWGGDSVKLAYMAELLSWNNCWGSKTMSKGSSGPRCTKNEQLSCGLKSFGLTNQSLKIFGQIGGSMCGEKLMKKLQPPELHKLYRVEETQLRCVCERGGGRQLQNRRVATGEIE